MLNDRAQRLLKILVERYIADGQPVGSRTLSRLSGLDLSPASIRNVMADLEEMGFIASPHTSAGRIPTARGYRYFVDTLLTAQPLTANDILPRLEAQLTPDSPQRLVSNASQLLSELTQFAGVVLAPRRKNLAIRHIEFLRMSANRVLLILVATDGSVQNRFLQTERDYDPSELIEAANFLNEHYAGCTFLVMRERLQDELRQLHSNVTALMTAALKAGEDALAEEQKGMVVTGEHNLLGVSDLATDVEHMKAMFEVFERKTALMQLLDASARAHGVQIFIGGESGLLPLDECSIVTSPYEIDGDVVGTLGVIGPTRMAYERVIPIVDVTARVLSSALSN